MSRARGEDERHGVLKALAHYLLAPGVVLSLGVYIGTRYEQSKQNVAYINAITQLGELEESNGDLEEKNRLLQGRLERLNSMTQPVTHLSGTLHAGSTLSWNGGDIVLAKWDCHFGQQVRLVFLADGQTHEHRCTIGESVGPLETSKGRLTLKVVKPDPWPALLDLGDRLEFEATYQIIEDASTPGLLSEPSI